ncbi:MAG: hypothetical protein FVQ81_00465 [Candidatus Glassbacteria bacterium]|nr:hypothetical protein [Candidatus Glassbacteria bacterium]
MGDYEVERRVEELERRIRELERDLRALRDKDTRRQGVVMRLAATGMALSEVLQQHKMIDPVKFEKRVAEFLASLDQEISEKKIGSLLDGLWKEFGSGKEG